MDADGFQRVLAVAGHEVVMGCWKIPHNSYSVLLISRLKMELERLTDGRFFFSKDCLCSLVDCNVGRVT